VRVYWSCWSQILKENFVVVRIHAADFVGIVERQCRKYRSKSSDDFNCVINVRIVAVIISNKHNQGCLMEDDMVKYFVPIPTILFPSLLYCPHLYYNFCPYSYPNNFFWFCILFFNLVFVCCFFVLIQGYCNKNIC